MFIVSNPVNIQNPVPKTVMLALHGDGGLQGPRQPLRGGRGFPHAQQQDRGHRAQGVGVKTSK